MRVLMTAIAICAVSFLAGVAGDLSIAAQMPQAQQIAAPSAVVPLPPHLENAVRARPLVATAAAEAAPARRRAPEVIAPAEKPRRELKAEPKGNPDRAPKGEAAKI